MCSECSQNLRIYIHLSEHHIPVYSNKGNDNITILTVNLTNVTVKFLTTSQFLRGSVFKWVYQTIASTADNGETFTVNVH